MRHRVLSLAVAGALILATAASAFAQVAVTTPFNTAGVSSNGRVDLLVGFSQSQGVPSVASGTFAVQVRATDPQSADIGTTLVPYVQDLDAYFASHFGWRSSKPVTVLLYSSSANLNSGLMSLTGGTLTVAQQNQAMSEPAALVMVTQGQSGVVPSDSWAILVNTDIDMAAQQFATVAGQMNSINNSLVPTGSTSGPVINPITFDTSAISQQQMFNNAMLMIQESIAKQYSDLMITDLGGNNVPLWLRQGLGNAIAFSIVPGTPMEMGWSEAVARTQNTTSMLPTLGQISSGGFESMLAVGGSSEAVAQGIVFLTGRSLINTVSGPQLADFLRGLGSGQNLNTQLSTSFGFDLNALNSQFQSIIPLP